MADSERSEKTSRLIQILDEAIIRTGQPHFLGASTEEIKRVTGVNIKVTYTDEQRKQQE